MNSNPDFESLQSRFDGPGVRAMLLMGSFARGEAGPFSDVDLVRIIDKGEEVPNEDESYLIDDRLIVVGSVTRQQVEEWFTRPEVAVNVIAGLRTARALIDRDNTFEKLQNRAHAFRWDQPMIQKAYAWVSREMVGWIEEVHKGLEGLCRNDPGRLLNARRGFSFGLSRVLCVYKGILLSGDNAFFEELNRAVGESTEWVRLRRSAFGMETRRGATPDLRTQVIAGLRLYACTAEMVADALSSDDAQLVQQTVDRIRAHLASVSP